MFYEIAVLKPEILKEIIDTYKHTQYPSTKCKLLSLKKIRARKTKNSVTTKAS